MASVIFGNVSAESIDNALLDLDEPSVEDSIAQSMLAMCRADIETLLQSESPPVRIAARRRPRQSFVRRILDALQRR